MTAPDTVRDLVDALAELLAPSTTEEHADRTARNTLELVQARRQLDAVRTYLDQLERLANLHEGVRAGSVVHALRAALAPQPAPTSGDPA